MDSNYDEGVWESMGITRPVYDEIALILGRLPDTDDIGTLLAMWDSNGRQQSLLGWLKGMRHVSNPDSYLYAGSDSSHRNIPEPRVAQCVEIAHRLSEYGLSQASGNSNFIPAHSGLHELLYLVGDVSSLFLDSEYARRCLHMASDPVAMTCHDEECAYLELILGTLQSAGLVTAVSEVRHGGLFAALVVMGAGESGFDILAPREVRLDAFLFGEEPGRYVVSLPEKCDDEFLVKIGEARLNCCFLGRVTKGRILIDGTDFGTSNSFFKSV